MKRFVRRFFFAITLFPLFFSCKGANKIDISDEKKEKEAFIITFDVTDKNAGSIEAMVEGKPIISGITKVEKDKEVFFIVTIKDHNYEIDDWEGAKKEAGNPLKAKLKVSKDAMVTAKLKKKGEEPTLTLKSLEMFQSSLDISDLKNIKTEVEYDKDKIILPKDVVAKFSYGTHTTPERIEVLLDKTDLEVGENIIKLSVPALVGSYKAWEQEVKISRKPKEKFKITFVASPSEHGDIIATVDGFSIESGVTPVEKDKDVIFTLTPKVGYTIEDWEGAKKDISNPFIAHLKVSKNAKVVAKLKPKVDPDLNLASLCIHNKDVEISKLNELKVEVENFVKTLSPTDIVATFTYGDDVTPKEIIVSIDKNVLNDAATLVNLSVPALMGSYKAWDGQVKIIKKPASNPNIIPNEIKLDGIEVALFSPKKVNGQYKLEPYIPIEDFSFSNAGPYTAQEAKTAYIAVMLKAEKPASGDYSIELSNKTTYIEPISFSRNTEGDLSYFIPRKVTLSKGYNVLEIKVKSPDDTKEGVYTLIVKYAGEPNQLDKPIKERKMLDGIYCPAQRKPLQGERADYVYLIAIAGW